MYAVIFDMDGVIFDSEAKVQECWEEIAEKYGMNDIQKTCRMCLGSNARVVEQIFKQQYGEDFDYARFSKKAASLFRERYGQGRLPKKPGILELLQYLKEHGIKTAVASSTNAQAVRQELEEGGLLSYFDVVVGGDMVTKSKPDPEIFLEACKKLQVSPDDAYIIEDSYNGIRAAYLAGSKPIMVPDLLPATEEMKEKSSIVLSSLTEVREWVKEKKEF